MSVGPEFFGIPEIWFLRAFMLLVLVVGGIISYYAYRSWNHSRARPMLFMAIGFALVSLGAAIAGIVYEVVTHGDYLMAWIVSSVFTLAGFVLILHSLLGRGEDTEETHETMDSSDEIIPGKDAGVTEHS